MYSQLLFRRTAGSRLGLYDIHVNEQQNVVVGCGLGGTSLINANVALEATPEVFDEPCWPIEIRADKDRLQEGYARAREMLKPESYPDSYPSLPKLEAHEKSAKALQQQFYRPPINVTFRDPEGGINHVGVEQKACTNCGDCVSGCNYGAKNTTLINYLPDGLRNSLAPHVRAYTKRKLRRLYAELPLRVIKHRRIYGGYDNIIARLGAPARLIRDTLYLFEGTPLDTFGLSHLLILEKTS